MKISEMHKNRIPGPGVERFCVLTRAGWRMDMAILDLSARARGWRGVETWRGGVADGVLGGE